MTTGTADLRVALLRGVNIGGNRLKMADLRRWCVDVGLAEVTTVVQTGNIVFRSTADHEQLAASIATRIADDAGFELACIILDAGEFSRVVTANPFHAAAAADPTTVHTAVHPEARGGPLTELDPDDSESIAVVGRAAYLHLPDGMGRSRLARAFSASDFGKVSTIRNQRTMARIDAVVAAARA